MTIEEILDTALGAHAERMMEDLLSDRVRGPEADPSCEPLLSKGELAAHQGHLLLAAFGESLSIIIDARAREDYDTMHRAIDWIHAQRMRFVEEMLKETPDAVQLFADAQQRMENIVKRNKRNKRDQTVVVSGQALTKDEIDDLLADDEDPNAP